MVDVKFITRSRTSIPDSQTSHPAEVMVVLKVFEKPSGELKCREERWWAISAWVRAGAGLVLRCTRGSGNKDMVTP